MIHSLLACAYHLVTMVHSGCAVRMPNKNAYYLLGLPSWLTGKEFPCQSRRCRKWGIQSLGLGRSSGEGKGKPLWYSCLGNPMDRGAWWAKVHGVANSQIRLRDSTTATILIFYFQQSHSFISSKVFDPIKWALALRSRFVEVKCDFSFAKEHLLN